MSQSHWVDLDVEEITLDFPRAFRLRLRGGKVLWVPKSCVRDADGHSKGERDVAVAVESWYLRAQGVC